MTRCFDFPEIVVHDPSQQCGRYKANSVCLPERAPEVATDKEEKKALESYQFFKDRAAGKPPPKGWKLKPLRADGTTISPDGEVVT